jgi:hypothetical protein
MAREWVITSPYGSFSLKHEADVISVGGKDVCVMIVYKGPEKSMLHWLGTNSQCELRGFPIKGDATKNMVYLATSVFRSLYQHVRHIQLIDSSSFKCALPDGKLHSIVLREAHFLFHGKTYYEDKFNAVPSTPDGRLTMQEFRDAFHNPDRKPKTFNFMDPTLTDLLTPIYNTENTWCDFFQAIQNKWQDKCRMIYLWYRLALYEMVEKTIPEHWSIDITRLPLIRPEFKPKSGGSKQTRKHRHAKMYPLDEPWGANIQFKWE